MYYHDLNISYEPFLHMIVEPETKYRFRYASEGGSHGGLAGRERNKGKKTYPTVQLSNYSGSNIDIFIRVSLCTEKKTDHVLQFKGKKSSQYRSYVDADLDENFCAVFKDLTILIPKKEDVYEALLDKRIRSIGRNLSKSAREKFEKEHKEEIKKEAKEIFNSVVLKFDAYEHARSDVQICPSYYSDPICNQKDSSKGELKICRLSQVTGSCNGGDEVILLCEKVQKDNVKIKFFEDSENDNGWKAYATFSPSDVHYQVAIPFKTPPYKDIKEKKRVQICLERGNERSEPRFFTYIPEDSPSRKRKRCMGEETLEQMPSPKDGSISSSSTVVPDNITENSGEFEQAANHQSLQEMFCNPHLDLKSLGQYDEDIPSLSLKDEDIPSLLLSPDFKDTFDVKLFAELIDDSIGSDTIFKESDNQSLPVNTVYNQSLLLDSIQNQGLYDLEEDECLPYLEEDQYIRPIGTVVGQMATTTVDAGKLDGLMATTMVDAGKLDGLMAVMNLKDSESDDESTKKVCKKEPKTKVLNSEQKKLEQFLPFIVNKDSHGNTLLHLLVLYKKSIKKTLQVIKMSDSDIINAQNNNKQTALHIAVEKNSAAVKELIQNSANPSIQNADGDNCCHLACRHNFVDCLESIFNPRRCHASILNDTNHEGLTPVHVALKYNSLSCLKFLFEQCYYLIDFSAVDSKLGQTYLHYAVQYSPSFVDLFIDEEEIEINCKDFDGNTPLHIACANGNYGVVMQLMKAGADPGIRNSKHNGSISDEEDSSDEASVGQTPADLTTNSFILKLLKLEDPSDVCLDGVSQDKEPDRIFEEIVKNLSSLLDSDMRWKQLAMYVLDEEYVTGLDKSSQNPTRNVLEYMKKTSGEKYIEQLIAVLNMVGFDDAVKVTNESCKPLIVI